MKLDHYHTPYIKINSNWNKDLNVRPETIKLLEEIPGVSSLTSILAMMFLDLTPKAKAAKAKTNKWLCRIKKLYGKGNHQ